MTKILPVYSFELRRISTEEVRQTMQKYFGNAKPMFTHKDGFIEDKKWLTSLSNQVLVRYQALQCHQQIRLLVLQTADHCLLFTAWAPCCFAPVSAASLLWVIFQEIPFLHLESSPVCWYCTWLKGYFHISEQLKPLKAEGCECEKEICCSLMAYYHPICNSDQL